MMQLIQQAVGYAALIIGALGCLYYGGRWLLSGAKWPSFKLGGSGTDEDTLDFQAWNRLRKRKSFQTTEAQNAFKVLAANFVEVTP